MNRCCLLLLSSARLTISESRSGSLCGHDIAATKVDNRSTNVEYSRKECGPRILSVYSHRAANVFTKPLFFHPNSQNLPDSSVEFLSRRTTCLRDTNILVVEALARPEICFRNAPRPLFAVELPEFAELFWTAETTVLYERKFAKQPND